MVPTNMYCAVLNLNLKDPIIKFLLRNAEINTELKAKDQAAAAAAAEGVTLIRLIQRKEQTPLIQQQLHQK